ncbi:MAG: protein kinase [Sandaracinaceae bacterium]|nr:protein kinase [Sandaracinaceae bacterium]
MKSVMEPGTQIGERYEILSLIAEGGMGAVYEAVHQLSRKVVALKVLHPELAHDEAHRQRFLREISAPAQIGHPNIIEIYDAGYDAQCRMLFVAMELLRGENLRERFDRFPCPRSTEVILQLLHILERVIDAIAAAHEKGFVHRDLKPENVFLHTNREGLEIVKVLDFGIARTMDSDSKGVTRTGTMMGTPEYMAPEQVTDARRAGPPADVWSLGVMIYEAFAGKTPFARDNSIAAMTAALVEAHPPLHAVLPSAPLPFSHLVDLCLAKRPEQRIPNASQLLLRFREARAQSFPLQQQPQHPPHFYQLPPPHTNQQTTPTPNQAFTPKPQPGAAPFVNHPNPSPVPTPPPSHLAAPGAPSPNQPYPDPKPPSNPSWVNASPPPVTPASPQLEHRQGSSASGVLLAVGIISGLLILLFCCACIIFCGPLLNS